ncbi:hypothetical protein BDV12DRAFT_197827 [Aspergillus spectabilis]
MMFAKSLLQAFASIAMAAPAEEPGTNSNPTTLLSRQTPPHNLCLHHNRHLRRPLLRMVTPPTLAQLRLQATYLQCPHELPLRLDLGVRW